jgi:hypothetical protein
VIPSTVFDSIAKFSDVHRPAHSIQNALGSILELESLQVTRFRHRRTLGTIENKGAFGKGLRSDVCGQCLGGARRSLGILRRDDRAGHCGLETLPEFGHRFSFRDAKD